MSQSVYSEVNMFNWLPLQEQFTYVGMSLLVVCVCLIYREILTKKANRASLWIAAFVVGLTTVSVCGYAKLVLGTNPLDPFFLATAVWTGSLAVLPLLPENFKVWKKVSVLLVILANIIVNLVQFFIPGRESLLVVIVVVLGFVSFPINIILYFATKNRVSVEPLSSVVQLTWIIRTFSVIAGSSLVIFMLAKAHILKYDFAG